MAQTTGTLKTQDGLTLFTQHWLPQAAPRALVVIAHGVGEHSTRYAHLGAYLAERGFAVYTLDHRGHGQSEGVRVHFDSFDQPVQDLEQYVERVQAAHPGLPLFVFGHSMGSLIALLFTLRNQNRMAGLISSGTPIALHQTVPAPAQIAARLVSSVAPRLRIIPLDVNGISRDPEVVARQKADPLSNVKPLPVGTISQLVTQGRYVTDNLAQFGLPLLVMHGEADPICPLAGSHLIMEQASSADKTLKTYPSMFHEIINEFGKEQVLADIGDWLAAHA